MRSTSARWGDTRSFLAAAGVAVVLAGLVPVTVPRAFAAAPGPASAPASQVSASSPTLVPLSGRGTAVMDGAWSKGEWDRAGRYELRAPVPASEGGGTTKALILVMNDDVNLYLAARIGTVLGCSFYPMFAFDSDDDGDPYDQLSDHLSAHILRSAEGEVRLFDSFIYDHNIDTDDREPEGWPPAGTIDGTAAGGHPNGTATFAEIAHPLDSADDIHDFSRAIGDTIRMHVQLSLQGGACGSSGSRYHTWAQAPSLGQFVVTFVPEDKVAPAMVGGPAVCAAVPSILGKGSTLISWSAEDLDGTGVGLYRVEQRKDGRSWMVIATTPATELRLALRIGHRYRYRVTPRDMAGNWGATATGPAFAPVLKQDRSSKVRYDGRWNLVRTSGASGGTVHATTRRGATVEITFTGYAIGWVTSTGPTRGRVAVSIDGVQTRIVDLYADATHWRRIRFSAFWSGGGDHTLELRALDGGARVDVDAFVIYR